MVLSIARDLGQILATARIPTGEPQGCMAAMREQILAWQAEFGRIEGIGVGAFGPVELDSSSPQFTTVLNSPKLAWKGFNWKKAFSEFCDAPLACCTDVGAAALAESLWGAGKHCRNVVYVTVGTGIGGSCVIDGKLLGGSPHAEFGHMPLAREADDDFVGVCPQHGACWEGLASGPAMQQRWGSPAQELPQDHPAWDLQARYLANGALALIACFAPEMVIFGGGVSSAPGLIERVRHYVVQRGNGYFASPRWDEQVHEFITLPALQGQAGVMGALHLAKQAANGLA